MESKYVLDLTQLEKVIGVANLSRLNIDAPIEFEKCTNEILNRFENSEYQNRATLIDAGVKCINAIDTKNEKGYQKYLFEYIDLIISFKNRLLPCRIYLMNLLSELGRRLPDLELDQQRQVKNLFNLVCVLQELDEIYDNVWKQLFTYEDIENIPKREFKNAASNAH